MTDLAPVQQSVSACGACSCASERCESLTPGVDQADRNCGTAAGDVHGGAYIRPSRLLSSGGPELLLQFPMLLRPLPSGNARNREMYVSSESEEPPRHKSCHKQSRSAGFRCCKRISRLRFLTARSVKESHTQIVGAVDPQRLTPKSLGCITRPQQSKTEGFLHRPSGGAA